MLHEEDLEALKEKDDVRLVMWNRRSEPGKVVAVSNGLVTFEYAVSEEGGLARLTVPCNSVQGYEVPVIRYGGGE